jgi:hypothetical protein
MGHEASGRTGQHRGSAMGAHYRHTTPEMAARVIDAIQQRLTVVLQVAGQSLESHPNRSALGVFLTGASTQAWELYETARHPRMAQFRGANTDSCGLMATGVNDAWGTSRARSENRALRHWGGSAVDDYARRVQTGERCATADDLI